MSWKTVTIGDVCTIVNGGTPKSEVSEYWDGDLNWITPKEMGKLTSREITSTERKITEKGIKNSSAKLLPINSVILSSRAPIGHLAINKSLMATNQGCKGLVPSEKLNYEYLYYFLSHSKQLLNDMGSGATFKELSGSKLATVEIPLPPIATQQKIVAKLDAIFAEIDKATAAAEANAKNAEALFQSYLTEVFERGGEDWGIYTIKDLIKIRSGDFLPAKNMVIDGVIDVYGGNGVSGKHNVHNLSGENIIIGRVGAKCGNVRLVAGDVWVTDNAFYVSEYKKNISKEFLSVALELKNLRTLANQMAQPVISFTTIKDAEIKVPDSLETQIEFLKIKNFLELQIKIIKDSFIKKSELLNLLRQAILKQAFSGELVKE